MLLIFLMSQFFLSNHASAQGSCSSIFETTLRPQIVTSVASKPHTRDEVLKSLKDLNPQLSEAQIEEKIKNSSNVYLFMRSFVTSFYDILIQRTSFSPTMKNLLEQIGWIFGDVHPENYGALLSDNGKARFTINDYDDNAYGPMAWDLIRFLTSIRLNNSNENLSEVIKSYRQGLDKKETELPIKISKLLKKSEENGRKTPTHLVDSDSEIIVRSSNTEELTDVVRNQIEEAIQNAYGNNYGKFLDGVIAERSSGGSGGLNRYHALIKIKEKSGSDSKLVLIEFKELIIAAPSKFTDQKQPSYVERIQTSLKIAQKDDISRFYSVQNVGDIVMFMRPRFEGNKGISLEKYNEQEQSEIIRFEAAVLGSLHRSSANDFEAYRTSFSKVTDEEFIKISQHMEEHFLYLYNLIRN